MKDKEKQIDNSWRAKMVENGIYKDSEITSEEKQIEEMAKDKQWQRRDNYCLRIQKALQYKGTGDNEDVPSILVDFENEIRKEISKDSVALSREDWKENHELAFMSGKKEGSKETAEKILNEVNEFFRPFDKKSPIFLDLLLTKLETVVKKFGVEIKE